MNVSTRIKAIKLMEKITANTEFTERSGIKVEMKKMQSKKQRK